MRRRYLPDTLVLETEFATAAGTIRLTDCMPPRRGDPVLVRLVEGVSGEVTVRMTLRARFEYGSAQPAVSRRDGAYRIHVALAAAALALEQAGQPTAGLADSAG